MDMQNIIGNKYRGKVNGFVFQIVDAYTDNGQQILKYKGNDGKIKTISYCTFKHLLIERI